MQAKKTQKFETATGKENFQTETAGRNWEIIVSYQILDTTSFTHVLLKEMISIAVYKKETSMHPEEGVLIVITVHQSPSVHSA